MDFIKTNYVFSCYLYFKWHCILLRGVYTCSAITDIEPRAFTNLHYMARVSRSLRTLRVSDIAFKDMTDAEC